MFFDYPDGALNMWIESAKDGGVAITGISLSSILSEVNQLLSLLVIILTVGIMLYRLSYERMRRNELKRLIDEADNQK